MVAPDGSETPSILLPAAYDVVWTAVLVLVVAALVAVAVILIRLALAGRRSLAATAELQEARAELAREQVARVRAGQDDGTADPTT